MIRTVLSLVSTLERTGPVAVLKGIVQNYDPREFRPVIATLSSEREQTYIGEFRAKGIEILPLNLTRFGSMIGGISRLKEVVRAVGADVVHCHGFRADLLIARARLDACTVSTIHAVLRDDYILNYGKLLGRWMTHSHYHALRRLNAPVSVSTAVAEAAAKHRVPSRTILNGVDTERYRPAASPEEYADSRAKLRAPAGTIVVLYAGALIPRKRPLEIIRCFKHSSISRDALLVIAGDGPLYDECRVAAEHTANVSLLGAREDLPELLRGADCLITASRSEGLPMALLEACASGVRIIASDIPPHREIGAMFPDKVTLFSGQEPDGLLRALKSLKLEFEKGSTNLAALEHISAHSMSHAYQNLYRELLAAANP
jgi:glycosyltransferase involved in cell wall biosynthesis